MNVRRSEAKGFAWNGSLESAVYSSRRAIPRRSPPGIGSTWACPSSRSRPTRLSHRPRRESRQFGPRSLRTPRTSVRAPCRSWSIIAFRTWTPCWRNSELLERRLTTESMSTSLAGSAGQPTRRATDSSFGSRAHLDTGKRTGAGHLLQNLPQAQAINAINACNHFRSSQAPRDYFFATPYRKAR